MTAISSRYAAHKFSSPFRDPATLCLVVSYAACEIIAGTRPLAQLANFVTPAVLDAVAQRAKVASNRPQTSGSRPRINLTRVRKARVMNVNQKVTEATVIMQDNERVRAMALRAELHRGRWRVAVLEMG